MRVRMIQALAIVLVWAGGVSAQTAELWPGTTYDPKIPTIRQVLGYDFGERITPPEDVPRYLRALAEAAPDRTRLVEYARSWQDRPLWLFVVGNRERMARLDEIRTARRRLADPRALSAGDIESLVAGQPVITALLHSVHGNEISGVDAALAEAYHLLAAQGEATVDLILRESIVLIDPMQNPDGRARFIASNTHGHAMAPDQEPAAAERDEPWPGGRSNHYLFDLNRDWFPLNHPETQGKVAFLLDWLPQVVVDLHEMGGESQYYFPPAAVPNAANTTEAQRAWMETFGRANAARFDARGFQYFNREVFDSFYPGYGASWPFYMGALGKTFEMASSRGLVYQRRDGSVLTYRDGVVRHFTAAIETAATAARNRERMLRDFIEDRRAAVADGGQTEYVLLPGVDASKLARLGEVLTRNGLDVRRVETATKAGAREIPAGALIVPLGQPMGRLVRTLLDPQTGMGEEFIAEQDRRRKLRLPDQIYDITAWSLPLTFDVELFVSERPTGARTTPVTDARAVTVAAGRVGYLIPWGTGTAAATVEALKAGLTVRSTGGAFTHNGRRYGIGTVLLRNEENPATLRETLTALAAAHHLEIVPIDSAWVEEGLSLGSNSVRVLKLPRVLIAWDAPTQSLSAGWARFTLERRFGQPVSAVRVSSLGRVNLHQYDVLVLPSGNYGTALDGVLPQLRHWIQSGGTLVTLAEASRWAQSDRVNLLGTYTELRDGRPDRPARDDEAARGTPPEKFDLDAALTPARERPEQTTGILARVLMNMEHWMSSGTDGEIQGMVEGDRVFAPLTLDRGTNVGLYADRERLLASGLMWNEARTQLAQKAFLLHQPMGQGKIVAFAEDPNFRGFAEQTQLLFMNAVLLGPVR
ncbi:MAG: M14 family zinc carboxypeptidase [Vicinamibacterales bacterium]|nr:M14 family zinc carboxypeptidase [Vicinamibacterales bacterium]